LSNQGLQGPIPIQLLSFRNLQSLYALLAYSISFPISFFLMRFWISKTKSEINKSINNQLNDNRYISLNYWECPVFDYSFILSNDYFNVSSECRNFQFPFLSFFFLHIIFLYFFSKNNKFDRNELPSKPMFKWRKMFNNIKWNFLLSMFLFLFWKQLWIRFFILLYSFPELWFSFLK